MVLFSALLWSINIIITKKISKEDSAITILAYQSIFMSLLSFIIVLFFSITGIYVMSFNNFDIYLMIGIAVVATYLRLYDFPMPPLILAFVLGGLMEENLRRSLLISDGSWTFLWDRTLTACILATTILIVVWQIYKSITKKIKI